MPEDDLRSTRAVQIWPTSLLLGSMCIVSHGYGGLGGAWMEVVDGRHVGQIQGVVGRMSGDARALSMCKVKTLMSPDLTAVKVCSSG